MIRQDLDGSVHILHGSVVIISADKLQKMLGLESKSPTLDDGRQEKFIQTILDHDGDIINLDISMEPQKHEIIKKYTVNNEGKNQTILEIRPSKLNMSRFLMKGELTSGEYFCKRFKELGIFNDSFDIKDLNGMKDWIHSEYKNIIGS